MDRQTVDQLRNFWKVSSPREARRKVSPRLATSGDRWDRETDRLVECLFSLMPDDLSNLNVLDLGCGNGRIMERLAGRCRSVTGIDISESMVEQARSSLEGNDNADVLVADPAKSYPPFGCLRETFDIVYSVLCLQHQPTLESVQSMLRQIELVTKPGGQVVLQTHGDKGLRPKDGKAGIHGWHMDASELRDELETVGLEVTQTTTGLYREPMVWAAAVKPNDDSPETTLEAGQPISSDQPSPSPE